MNEFLEQFLVESRELVEQATAALATLERSPRDAAAIDALLRALHTLKGGAGIVEFGAMEQLLHASESRLSGLKSGGTALTPQQNAECLASLDLVVRWLDLLEGSGALPADAGAQAEALLSAGKATTQHANPLESLESAAQAVLQAQLDLLAGDGAASLAGHIASAGAVAQNLMRCLQQDEAAARIAAATTQSLAGGGAAPLQHELQAALAQLDMAEPAPASVDTGARGDGGARTLRIDAVRVELLVRLAGELSVIRNALGHTAGLAQDQGNALAGTLKEQLGVLDRVTTELQNAVLGLRVLPLRTVFRRFPPVLREMAANLGKPVRLKLEGDDTEADKAIVELLFEPLLHVVRNAMDHGIETPAERARAGKAQEATIVLRAWREADRVLVEVEDDGRGVDVERVRNMALARGIVSGETLDAMTEAEIVELVFAPGFSTSAAVTELSGRGVGMDAARAAVGRIGGNVTIHSRPGMGTRVCFSLPFSVMMTQVLTVEAGGQTFGIPVDAVVETIRVPVASLSGVGAAHALAHRNRTLPVFELTQLLQVQAPPQPADEVVIVVVTAGGQWGGIRVDRPGDRMEVMLKPLEGLLSGVPCVTGTTIMGDGRVLLVLDPGAILV